MNRKLPAYLILVFLLQSILALAQVDTVKIKQTDVLILNDSIIIPFKDTFYVLQESSNYKVVPNPYAKSQKFFDSLYVKSYRSKISKKLYKLLVTYRPIDNIYNSDEPIKSESFFKAAEGRSVSEIRIIHVDMLTGSVIDTTIESTNRFKKFANFISIRATDKIIRNQLLFRPGDEINPFMVAESERILRSLAFIQDVRLRLKVDSNSSKTTDLIIIVKERVPYAVSGSIQNEDRFDINISSENIFGTANQFKAKYLHKSDEEVSDGYELSLRSRNIGNTFTQLNGFYAHNFKREGYGFGASKDFISPEIKYGGEASYSNIKVKTDIAFADSLLESGVETQTELYDLWLGRSFTIKDQLNLSFSARYKENQYPERPSVAADFNEFYHQRKYALGAVYLTKLNYFKDKFIQSFNITEDVPVGFSLSLIGGHDWSEFNTSYYLGQRLSFANFFNLGYALFSLESGSYLRDKTLSNSVISTNFSYFTPLLRIGKTYNRNFLRSNLVLSRNLGIPLSQNLSGSNLIRGLRGQKITGDQLFNINLESVFFLPWFVYGFRFATFAYSDLGFVEEDRIINPYLEYYQVIGGGVRFKNESLVFQTLEFRLAYFTKKPVLGESYLIEFKFIKRLEFGKFNVVKPSLIGLPF